MTDKQIISKAIKDYESTKLMCESKTYGVAYEICKLNNIHISFCTYLRLNYTDDVYARVRQNYNLYFKWCACICETSTIEELLSCLQIRIDKLKTILYKLQKSD